MAPLPVYMDYNATTPCDERVLAAMLPFFTQHYGNAASKHHSFGWSAQAAVDIARQQVATLVGATDKEIVFTSGATEAVNLAIKGVAELYAIKGNHIITTAVEHSAVLDTCRYLEKKGIEVTYLPVDASGQINVQELEAAIRPTTILIAAMYANNETGTIFPVKTIGAIAKQHSVLFFTDATQAVGKLPIDVVAEDIDLLALSAHKLYGPKGVGALYIRRRNPRVQLQAQLQGGGHEQGWRSGTLNVPGIVGLGKACSLAAESMQAENERLILLRNRLEQGLLALPETYVNGDKQNRLSHVSNISFRYVPNQALITGVTKHIAVSSGSACASASGQPSHVLLAMGRGNQIARSSLRFSLGRFTTEEEVNTVIELVTATVNTIRSQDMVWQLAQKDELPDAADWKL
ncbi:cysteine desulfurase family protein [Terrimonas rubra]|uniref:cysteine desulfurase n=1 Tax=Terrimonas rubra TaxID=1035890 RepID=A0ABW6A1D6_9BACT